MWPFKSKNVRKITEDIIIPEEFSIILRYKGTHPMSRIDWEVALSKQLHSGFILEVNDNLLESLLRENIEENRRRISFQAKGTDSYSGIKKENIRRQALMKPFSRAEISRLISLINDNAFFSFKREYDLPVCGAGIAKLQITLPGQFNEVEVRGTDKDMMRRDKELAVFLRIWEAIIDICRRNISFKPDVRVI